MSRVVRTASVQGGLRYWMECDEEDCDVAVGPRKSEDALPLWEFAAEGWFIAQWWGDCCPDCVKAGRAEGRVPYHPDQLAYRSINQTYSDGLGVEK